jgi:nucleoside-diphosphate-sugar epimerase
LRQSSHTAGKIALEDLVRAKHAHPVESADLMAPDVFGPDDEVDEFIAAVREWRQADLG